VAPRRPRSAARARGSNPVLLIPIAAKLHKLRAEDTHCRTSGIALLTSAISLELSGFGDEYAIPLMSAVADELQSVKRRGMLPAV
jgi:hypothetical protein